MVDGINFTNIGKTTNITGVRASGINTNGPPNIKFSGVDPPKYSTGIERNVVPEELLAKFENVQAAKYTPIRENTDFIKESDYRTTGIISDRILDIPEGVLSG